MYYFSVSIRDPTVNFEAWPKLPFKAMSLKTTFSVTKKWKSFDSPLTGEPKTAHACLVLNSALAYNQ